MKAKVAAPVLAPPDMAAVSAAVCSSRAAPICSASPPAVPCHVTIKFRSPEPPYIAEGATVGREQVIARSDGLPLWQLSLALLGVQQSAVCAHGMHHSMTHTTLQTHSPPFPLIHRSSSLYKQLLPLEH